MWTCQMQRQLQMMVTRPQPMLSKQEGSRVRNGMECARAVLRGGQVTCQLLPVLIMGCPALATRLMAYTGCGLLLVCVL